MLKPSITSSFLFAWVYSQKNQPEYLKQMDNATVLSSIQAIKIPMLKITSWQQALNIRMLSSFLSACRTTILFEHPSKERFLLQKLNRQKEIV